jgi:hypothetical protein
VNPCNRGRVTLQSPHFPERGYACYPMGGTLAVNQTLRHRWFDSINRYAPADVRGTGLPKPGYGVRLPAGTPRRWVRRKDARLQPASSRIVTGISVHSPVVQGKNIRPLSGWLQVRILSGLRMLITMTRGRVGIDVGKAACGTHHGSRVRIPTAPRFTVHCW